MKISGGTIARGILAMTGGRSPWGGGDKGREKPSGEAGSSAGAPGVPDDEAGAAENPPPSRGPRNPWIPSEDGQPRRSANIEDIFRIRNHRRGGGGGGGQGGPGIRFPGGQGKWFPWLIGGIAAIWLGFSMVHQLGPKEQGIVTTFGKYSHTIGSGISFTLPWPIQDVDIENVSEFKIETIPEGEAEKLMLTGDRNIVDLSYVVRWSIKDLKDYRFRLVAPDDTVREVAEAAMRASVAEETLDRVLSGAGRAYIEQRVMTRMQNLLDAYKSGVLIQGVEIRKTDPPGQVEEAFKDVSAAQQEAESYRNQARAWAQQVLARAQGDAAAFDKVYEQYRLAPEVTRRRMYYETMERVLRKTDKTIVEAPGITPYLPLPEMKRRPPAEPQKPGGQ